MDAQAAKVYEWRHKMKAKRYTVENLDMAYGGRPPWGRADREVGLTELQAIKRANELNRVYHREQNSWSGHVRIVGDDGWVYDKELGAYGQRATLRRVVHLDDI